MSTAFHRTPPRRCASANFAPSPSSRTPTPRFGQGPPPERPVLVAVRVRPPLEIGQTGLAIVPPRFRECVAHRQSAKTLLFESAQGQRTFQFDQVFDKNAKQQDIYLWVRPAIDKFVAGYNVGVLCYGQSGSGKSYTIGTSQNQAGPDLGLIPRVLQTLFDRLEGAAVQSRSYSSASTQSPRSGQYNTDSFEPWSMAINFVEIYNEDVTDLMNSSPSKGSVTIHTDSKNQVSLYGIREIKVTCYEDAIKVLRQGLVRRQTNSTLINAESSRSHAIFTIKLIQHNIGDEVAGRRSSNQIYTRTSKFNFVDLAGSERLDVTKASGRQAKEGISINSGLTALSKVISQLAKHSQGHVPYRDSKLTRMLQDTLGGNSYSYLIACVTPEKFYQGETQNTLGYAQRASGIRPNSAIFANVGVDHDLSVNALQAEIQNLREYVSELELKNASLTEDAQKEKYVPFADSLSAHLSGHSEDTEYNESGRSVSTDHDMSNLLDLIQEVILEYETTIESLKLSLDNSREACVSWHSELLAAESKLAYQESVSKQLLSRLERATSKEDALIRHVTDLERVVAESEENESSRARAEILAAELSEHRENEQQTEKYVQQLENRLAECEMERKNLASTVYELQHRQNFGSRQASHDLVSIPSSRTGLPATPRTPRSDGAIRARIQSEFSDSSDDSPKAKMTPFQRLRAWAKRKRREIHSKSQTGGINNEIRGSHARRASDQFRFG